MIKMFVEIRKDGRKGRDGDGDGVLNEGEAKGGGVGRYVAPALAAAGAVGLAALGVRGVLRARALSARMATGTTRAPTPKTSTTLHLKQKPANNKIKVEGKLKFSDEEMKQFRAAKQRASLHRLKNEVFAQADKEAKAVAAQEVRSQQRAASSFARPQVDDYKVGASRVAPAAKPAKPKTLDPEEVKRRLMRRKPEVAPLNFEKADGRKGRDGDGDGILNEGERNAHGGIRQRAPSSRPRDASGRIRAYTPEERASRFQAQLAQREQKQRAVGYTSRGQLRTASGQFHSAPIARSIGSAVGGALGGDAGAAAGAKLAEGFSAATHIEDPKERYSLMGAAAGVAAGAALSSRPSQRAIGHAAGRAISRVRVAAGARVFGGDLAGRAARYAFGVGPKGRQRAANAIGGTVARAITSRRLILPTLIAAGTAAGAAYGSLKEDRKIAKSFNACVAKNG